MPSKAIRKLWKKTFLMMRMDRLRFLDLPPFLLLTTGQPNFIPMTSVKQTPELTSRCPICGQKIATTAITWSDQTEQPVCPQCLAEEENCGCADD